ncbi:MAG: hypothetical protein BMS9Abin26_0213 [Gammaproteobacteria bacterium]|nr:MAG: hypothetical protein BMS9Abin26_0213 [Gammaproteobacteria bacterium]
MKSQDFLDLTHPLPYPFYLVSADGIILAANPAAIEMLGIDAPALNGKRLADLVTDSADRVRRYLKACSKTRQFVPGVLTWYTKHGELLESRTDGAALLSAPYVSLPLVLLRLKPKEEHETRFAFLNRDLESLRTEHLRLMDQKDNLEERIAERTAELERSNKELDQFAYVTSHDLKAPLRAIANLSQWIEEDISEQLTDDTRKQMDLLRGRVKRMEALIDGILRYSRVGRIDVDIETVDVAKMLDEIIESQVPPVGLSIDIGPDMPVFDAASVRLQQVFANLISNAIKYHHREDGHIEITVADSAEFYEFIVADDGPGIAPEFHEKIFQIFQTLQAKDTRESTGVGLTLVKKIVEEQGGTIRVESTEGQGATFRFSWPKQPAAETGPHLEQPVTKGACA